MRFANHRTVPESLTIAFSSISFLTDGFDRRTVQVLTEAADRIDTKNSSAMVHVEIRMDVGSTHCSISNWRT